MPPEHKLLQAQMTQVAQEILLECLTNGCARLLALSSPEVQSRARKAMKAKLQTSRLDQTDMRDDRLTPEQSNLQTSLFREAFDEAAQKIEKALGLPT